MIFNQGSEPSPVNLVKIVNKNTAVGIAHLQSCDVQGFIADLKRIINHSIERLVSQHRNRRAVELWLT